VWQEEERFPEGQQCDAHELLVHLLDSLAETLNAARGATGAGVGGNARGSVAPLVSVSVESPSVSSGKSITLSRSEFLLAREPHLWVDRIFQGATTTEVRCTRCGTSTTRDEVFRDLSLDVSDNTSVYHSLKRFTAPEVLSEFQCPKCPARVKATRSVRFLALPRTLVLHLKRFRGKVGSEPVKLPHRVVFPRELCLAVLSAESCMRRDRRYELFAVVAHVGRGLSSGHYVCLARHGPQWFLYDDDVVVAVTEDDLQSCFGSPHRDFSNEAYLLFYSAA
jgi:ubiquitin carboxyl-terminal hydrolase 12/46